VHFILATNDLQLGGNIYTFYWPKTSQHEYRNLIVLELLSHIAVSNHSLNLHGKATKSTVSDNIKVSLLPINPLEKCSVILLEACFRCQEVSWRWTLRLCISI
jgi:hypothetical protein